MERVIVGYDDSPAALGALAWAIHHAQRSDAELVIVCLVSSSFERELNAALVNTDPIRKELQRRLRGQWTESVRAAGVRYQTQLERGRPAEALLDAARRKRRVAHRHRDDPARHAGRVRVQQRDPSLVPPRGATGGDRAGRQPGAGDEPGAA